MEGRFTPEQESQISRIALHVGTDVEQLVKEATLRMLEEDKQFRTAVRRGMEQADRGEVLPHHEVVARIERLLRP
jgi:predicted transcriptional regulator